MRAVDRIVKEVDARRDKMGWKVSGESFGSSLGVSLLRWWRGYMLSGKQREATKRRLNHAVKTNTST